MTTVNARIKLSFTSVDQRIMTSTRQLTSTRKAKGNPTFKALEASLRYRDDNDEVGMACCAWLPPSPAHTLRFLLGSASFQALH